MEQYGIKDNNKVYNNRETAYEGVKQITTRGKYNFYNEKLGKLYIK